MFIHLNLKKSINCQLLFLDTLYNEIHSQQRCSNFEVDRRSHRKSITIQYYSKELFNILLFLVHTIQNRDIPRPEENGTIYRKFNATHGIQGIIMRRKIKQWYILYHTKIYKFQRRKKIYNEFVEWLLLASLRSLSSGESSTTECKKIIQMNFFTMKLVTYDIIGSNTASRVVDVGKCSSWVEYDRP